MVLLLLLKKPEYQIKSREVWNEKQYLELIRRLQDGYYITVENAAEYTAKSWRHIFSVITKFQTFQDMKKS